jgi:hypothetical protein
MSRRVLVALIAFALQLSQHQIARAADAPPKPKKQPRWQQMDYGPFLSLSVENATKASYDNNTGFINADTCPRGLLIKLGDDWNTGVVFDMDLLRIACGWNGAPPKWYGIIFGGEHGHVTSLNSEPVFRTPQGPGWADYNGSFKDPRKDSIKPLPPPGPLPREWAKYRGLYKHGDRVILSYSVGKTDVLEMPSLESHDSLKAFARTFHIGPSADSMNLMLAEVKGQRGLVVGNLVSIGDLRVAVVDLPADARLEVVEGQVRLNLPARKSSVAFKVLLAGGPSARDRFASLVRASSKPVDLTTLTHGGPASWTGEIETKGVVAKSDQPYVVDNITLPYENPWHAWMRPGGFDFFTSDPTKAALCTWSGDVWIVSGIDDTLEHLKWKRFATGMHQLLGLKIVDDVIYTVGHDQITRLHDLNGDGEADFYENFNNDWELTTAFHAFCFDLHTDPLGNFFFAFGSPVRAGGPGFHNISAHHGSILRVSKDGSKLDIYATGFRAPNGMCVGPHGEITIGDNEGSWVPKCPLHWIKEGSFNGVVNSAHREVSSTVPPKPLCWMPKDVDNSSGAQVWVTSDKWGPFAGELLHMSYGTSSLFKVLKEEVNGQMQGGVVKFPVKFTSSAMRARFNTRDGQLYVAGLSGWQSNAARDGGFDRVRYTGKPVHMPTGLHVTAKGVSISFTTPLDAASVADAENYSVDIWNYKWTATYGSGDYSTLPQPNGKPKEGRDPLTIKSATLSADGKTVFLEVPDIKPAMQMKIRIKIKAADGTPINTDIHNTIHNLAL